ncbi:hypothetical protein Tco_0631613 [Tanacetum coccineum]
MNARETKFAKESKVAKEVNVISSSDNEVSSDDAVSSDEELTSHEVSSDDEVSSEEEVTVIASILQWFASVGGSTWPAFDYIYNPSTNLFKRIPRQENSYDDSRFYRSVVLRMDFDFALRKSLDYKVVQVGRTYSDIDIQNDALHWLETKNRQLTLYKLNIEDHDHPIITTIEIPHGLHRGRNFLDSCGSCDDLMLILIDIHVMLHLEGRLFESCGYLLLVYRDDIGSREFTIYEMMNGCSLWMVSNGLGEKKEDSFLVINLSRKIVKYNLISKTISEIFDIGSNQMDDDDDDEFISPYTVDHNLYEFIPSLQVVRDKALLNVC